jgi:hypothetical protein
MVHFHETKQENDPHIRAKSWRPITSGLRNWRTEMRPSDVESFEAAAGDLLEEIGYLRCYARPSTAAIKRAGKIFEALTEEVLSKGGQLPSRWEYQNR